MTGVDEGCRGLSQEYIYAAGKANAKPIGTRGTDPEVLGRVEAHQVLKAQVGTFVSTFTSVQSCIWAERPCFDPRVSPDATCCSSCTIRPVSEDDRRWYAS